MTTEKQTQYDRHEQETSPRFSFADPRIGRTDIILSTSQPFSKIRRIEYSPNRDNTAAATAGTIRTGMYGAGLLLGKSDPAAPAGSERFVIPPSARPIEHDASMNSNIEFIYDDKILFQDLGRMLGTLANQHPKNSYTLQHTISHNIAFVEFTRQDEKKLLFVPGFEQFVSVISDKEEALEQYDERLTQELGDRFTQNAGHFEQGFDEGER
jgi:hypothetical protein